MIAIPILFLLCGYSLVYIVGRPVIHFTSSSLQLFLLSELPKFEKNEQTLPELDKQTIETNEQTIFSSQIVYPRAGARGFPASRPSGVFPVFLPYTTFEVIVNNDVVGVELR